MTDDFDNIFTEPEKQSLPDPALEQFVKPMKQIIHEIMMPAPSPWLKERHFQAKTVTLGHPATDTIINEFLRDRWYIHFTQNHGDQLLIIFCRELQSENKQE